MTVNYSMILRWLKWQNNSVRTTHYRLSLITITHFNTTFNTMINCTIQNYTVSDISWKSSHSHSHSFTLTFAPSLFSAILISSHPSFSLSLPLSPFSPHSLSHLTSPPSSTRYSHWQIMLIFSFSFIFYLFSILLSFSSFSFSLYHLLLFLLLFILIVSLFLYIK